MNNCSSSLFNNNNNEHLDWLTFSENQEKKEKKRKKRRWMSRKINLTTISFSFIPCLEFFLFL